MDIATSILLSIGVSALALFIAFGLAFGVPLLFKIAFNAPAQKPNICQQNDRRQGINPPFWW